MAEAPTAEAARRGPSEHEAELGREADSVASFGRRRPSLGRRFHDALHGNPTLAPLIVLALSCAVFGLIAPNFFSPFNLSLIIQQVTIIGLLGAAQTLVILTAGIDLSVAAIMVLSYMVMARLGVEAGPPSILAILVGLGVGLACGLFNGSLVTKLRPLPVLLAAALWFGLIQLGAPVLWAVPVGVFAALALIAASARAPALDVGFPLRLPPFIATLGAWSIFFALNLWYAQAQTVRSQDLDASAPFLKFFGERVGLFGAQFTYGSFLMLAVFVALWYALSWTAWGRSVYAVGDDKDAAELSGIRTDRVLMSVYGLAGLLCALAGWAAIGRVGSAAPQAFYEGNLDAITAVVIGGTSLFGGRGVIFGTLIGALIVGVFRSGLALSGVDVLWQTFAVGLLIIVAVAMDQWIRRVTA